MIAGEGNVDDILEYDGLVRENRPSFRRTGVTELACAIEADTTPDTTEPIHSSCDQPGAIAEAPDSAVPPLLDADHAHNAGGRGEEAKEIPTSSRAPPSGWRRDDFGSPIRRSVWTPPWSLRPPHLEPEPWLSLTKKHQADERQRWRAGDPDGFELQEERRRNYIRLKNAGRVPKAAACRPILPCDYNDLYDGHRGLDSVECPVDDRDAFVRSAAPAHKSVGGVDLSSQRAPTARCAWISLGDWLRRGTGSTRGVWPSDLRPCLGSKHWQQRV